MADRSGPATLVIRLMNRSSTARAISARISRPHAAILRASRGRIRRSRLFALGQPVMVITTTGRKSGRRRSTVVAYFKDGEDFIISAGNLGSGRDPAWVLNLQADPKAAILVDGESRQIYAHRAEGEQRERLWARWEEIPVFILSTLSVP
jgi:deazaflavin-dependent oxidoreductase (nitroreductase family)